jgi:hypothetical protein
VNLFRDVFRLCPIRFVIHIACCFVATFCSFSASLALSQIDVRDYGAACNWNNVTHTGTDDTAAFNAASSAANIIYLHTGAPINVTVPYGCEIEHSVVQKSGTHFAGPGSIYVPVNTDSPTFIADMSDDVAITDLEIVALTNSSSCSPTSNNDLCAAIAWQTSSREAKVKHRSLTFKGNRITNFGWGIVVLAADGTDTVSDVDVEGNTVISSTPYSFADGIHLGGSISGFTISNNYVYGRSDSAIAVTSETDGHLCSGGTITGNIVLENRVGIDDSGCQDLTITGNNVRATTPITNDSNPAFRSIYYGGVTPQRINVTGNTFINYVDPSDDHAAKFDNYGGGSTRFYASFTDNMTSFIYVRGSSVSVASNTMPPGAGIYLDYDVTNGIPSDGILVGTNNWLGGGQLTAGANPALFTNNHLATQLTAGTITYTNAANFTP